ncbi:cell cycle RNA binding protein whi3 [Exophiala xenobiotica]|uniref:Cell cycle RNA binding protein whi3 n=1 Tax=Vermiconidia calcicola TaxID=1690605 RepID=A0AAV9QL21_9PEZI|nr:cell cycle RNA binding protein whi3 [Exophiala xenobiotica]KAK5308319.1 cell cycle RNA binding protein whi3 [Exophiala xenobiotica]KAK5437820.1 cell cycle RNA binding protein whi3 [Exophiala xenobiotica]KAK5545856.1 cell cycle RNA binding protein whi3 [Vermiconidia calcicola]KAK5554620.1 cell cycle RNA binding protein whi3 [Exophiala xenobiotica]
MPSHLASFEAASSDRRMSTANEGLMALPTVMLRRLPKNMTPEAVRTMLLFAKDLQDTEIIPNEYDEDAGFATGIARFGSMTGASEAQAMLDGKSNTAGQAKMIVNIISNRSLASMTRRNTIDPVSGRKIAQSLSPPLANAQKSSRFNGTFQALDQASSPPVGSPPDYSSSDSGPPMQTSALSDRSRVSGKTVIDEDGGDDDTRELLKDPLAYMHSSSMINAGRNPTNHRAPTAAFQSLSLNTNMGGASSNGYASPRSAVQARTPHSQFSPAMSTNGQYGVSNPPYLRHNYPPVNPADQNPPCNTLYVGNLPIDTSEDELKAMFSKQRGYKRLCFRTKQNGPMCFVEFEDISFATKALNELYGAQLHNSVKGGIRLSFSKNPLGVRSGQPGSPNPATPLTSTGPMNLGAFGGMAPGSFTTANGPPPGLSAPPGLNMTSNGVNGVAPPPAFVNQGFPVGSGAVSNLRALGMNNSPANQNMGGMYADYMLGR